MSENNQRKRPTPGSHKGKGGKSAGVKKNTRNHAQQRLIARSVKEEDERRRTFTKEEVQEQVTEAVQAAKVEVDASHEATIKILKEQLDEKEKQEQAEENRQKLIDSRRIVKHAEYPLMNALAVFGDWHKHQGQLEGHMIEFTVPDRDDYLFWAELMGYNIEGLDEDQVKEIMVPLATVIKALNKQNYLDESEDFWVHHLLNDPIDVEYLASRLDARKIRYVFESLPVQKENRPIDPPKPDIPAPKINGPLLDLEVEMSDEDSTVNYRFFERKAAPLDTMEWLKVMLAILVALGLQWFGLNILEPAVNLGSMAALGTFGVNCTRIGLIVVKAVAADMTGYSILNAILNAALSPIFLIVTYYLYRTSRRLIPSYVEILQIATVTRPGQNLNQQDHRADLLSLMDMKHTDPLISYAKITTKRSIVLALPATLLTPRIEILRLNFWTNWYELKGGASHEMLAQICTAKNIKWGAKDDVTLMRISTLAEKVCTINLDKYAPIQKQHIVQNTILVAYFMFKDMEHTYRKVPFPETSLKM